MSVHLLGVSGSLRRDSHNTALLRAAAELAPAGVTFQILDGLREVPPYDGDDDTDPAPPAVAALRETLAGADGVLFATPEYNASIPGVLKNAIDWASRPLDTNALRGTPVAVMGATTGSFGAVWAQAELRKVLGTLGARVLEDGVAVPRSHERIGPDGFVAGDDLRAQIATVVAALAREAGIAASPATTKV